MEFNCNTFTSYFLKEEKEHLFEFLSKEIESGQIYTNSKGEKRHVTRFFYPYGLIVDGRRSDKENTFYYPGFLKDGSRLYHTPLATLKDCKVAKINYIEKDEHASCDSVEWLEWMGNSVTIEVIPEEPEPPEIADLRAQKAAEIKATAESHEDFKKESESREWKAGEPSKKVSVKRKKKVSK